MTDITWTNVTVKLSQLIPWEDNPKTSTAKNATQLQISRDELGQFQTVAIEPTGRRDVYRVADGHQRLSSWLMKYGKDSEIDARLASRELTETERRKIAIYSRQIGAFNFDTLSGWDEPLIDWGLDSDLLGQWGQEYSNLAEMLGAEEEPEPDDNYSRKIEAPIYTPKGDKPAIKDLYDETRAAELLAEIDAADLPEDEKEFLRVAARRHTVINFKRVAEYYSHSPASVQELMENSALVIIDFNRAIELGYVKLSEEIAAQYGVDYGTS